ncbi:hypothetical protein RA307_11060 [Xanthobacteraceae bacterium Astr-EGSB]|uniref:hypothetical protein n=1 Tax=Astrobacterium formosum TaxID=3069710 RepID=UPI0027AE5F81|nr:hypothetical protein [Xanthobacteraceae bacterium Astr-EGSB]
MRMFLGLVLGALLTVTGAYAYDNYAPRNDPAARPMVNWDVVRSHWNGVEASLRDMGNRVHDEWAKRAG